MDGSILDGVKKIIVRDTQTGIDLAMVTADTVTTAADSIVVKLVVVD